ncbi:MAG: phospholipid-binding protein [Actinobacteria bacterium]|nr:MAG: phospholipid-binding protein [Actinomycetota bacterium]
MDLTSTSITDGEVIGRDFALAEPADEGHVTFAGNNNPHLAWSDVPATARSFVVTCIDIDAPSVGDDVNKEDREVPADLERADFTHWLLANLPSGLREVEQGTHSTRVTPRGKPADAAPVGVHGVNDYTMWFDGDPDLEGHWNGYDGCAPPWNDSIPHRYRFTVYALDAESLDLDPGFTREALTSAMTDHIVDSASITGTYTTNPRLR